MVAARIATVPVSRGDSIVAGEVLARIDADDALLAVASAKAAMSKAEAELADLQHGSRLQEIAALQAAVSSARANAEQAAREAERQAGLRDRRVASQAQFEGARAMSDMAAAALAEAEAKLATARLPARDQRINAAVAALAQARSAWETSRWQLSQCELRANSAGIVTDIIRCPGEIAGPSPTCLMVRSG